MKKNVLALSITAALVGLGFAQSALAITVPGGASLATGISTFAESRNGTGHVLLVPYYSVQGSNTTLLNLVNTDTVHGKAVKVRFRGAANSDDVFDFQVFLSPADVFAVKVSQGTDFVAKLDIGLNGGKIDTSCVKPNLVDGGVSGKSFVTDRLDPSLTAEQKANHTREGYVEIFNMADIPSGTALYTAIKHVKGVAPCSGAAWERLDSAADFADLTAAKAGGLYPPTTGLMANWTIFNTTNATTFGAPAVALGIVDSANNAALAYGNVVYWPQTAEAVTNPGYYTADPLLAGETTTFTRDTNDLAGTPKLAAAFYDLPDLSTPYVYSSMRTFGLHNSAPRWQANQLSSALATTKVMNEYINDEPMAATTDWVFSMPTRRYSVAADYSASDDLRVYSRLPTDYFLKGNTAIENRIICVTGITPKAWDREEQTTTTGTVISPSTVTKSAFCGETSLLAINTPTPTVSNVLGGTISVKGLMANNGAFKNGWIALDTPAAYGSGGLPILGGAFTSAKAGGFILGASWEHRYSRSNAQVGE